MNADERRMIAEVMAQQDQDLEAAIEFASGSDVSGKTFNAQMIPLWQACALDHPNPLIESMSRFAMIGIRAVLMEIERRSSASIGG